MNIPNSITIARIFLVPLFMFFMYSGVRYANQIATLIFVITAITDFIDGYLARKYKLITNLGKVLDPVADKFMITGAMIILVEQGKLAAWIVIIMVFRDQMVGALRDMVSSQGEIIAAGIFGKIKTNVQIVAIGFIMFYDTLILYPTSEIGIVSRFFTPDLQKHFIYIPSYSIGQILIYFALFASVFSGIMYFVQFRRYVFK